MRLRHINFVLGLTYYLGTLKSSAVKRPTSYTRLRVRQLLVEATFLLFSGKDS